MNMGEAILIVGPDGTSVLVDTANDSQSASVFEAVERRLGARAVDWVVLTHYHNDHIGGFDNLFVASAINGDDPLVVTRGVVTRGFVDVAEDTIAVEDFLEVCGVLASEEWAALRYDLCSAPSEMPCGGGATGVPWPADGCPGLTLGDLGDPGDDGDGLLSYLALGAGARLYLYQADAHFAAEGTVISAEDEGLSVGWGGTEPENARSVGGALRWGDFTWTFNGDTPADEPAIEALIAGHASGISPDGTGAPLIPDGDADVVHLGHHGLSSSTGQPWVDWLLPDDGRDRNAAIGATSLYYHSPAQEVLDRVGPRAFEGRIWTTALGILPGSHEKLIVANGAVAIRVVDGGASYEISVWSGGIESELREYGSTAP
jgi:beta-lactamase superfamily II metal-dependent hydrolase